MWDDILSALDWLNMLPYWRYFVCVGFAIMLSLVIHFLIPGNFWDWFISVPLVGASIWLAWLWKNEW